MMKLAIPSKYKCPFCRCSFENPTILQQHRMGTHKMDPASSQHYTLIAKQLRPEDISKKSDLLCAAPPDIR